MVEEVKTRGNPCEGKISSRYILAVLGSVGLGIVYGLKVNLHVAIVSMVNHTAVAATEGSDHESSVGESNCASEVLSNSTAVPAEDGPFAWPGTVQGILLSAYFWGYLVAQIPGGRVAELFSAKWVMFFSVAINIVCTLLTPLMAQLHFGALIAMRIGEGIGGGVSFPAMHVMLAHWAPPSERSVMSSIVYAGTALGTVVFMLVSGIIAGAVGWAEVFYIEGGVSLIWLILWTVLVADSPTSQRFISKEERDFIVSSLNQGQEGVKHEEKHKMPWKSVLTSPAFLAILVAHTCSNWGWYMVLIELPLYMKTALNFKISENAVLTAVPFLCMWLFSLILSKTLDTLRERKFISTTTARKTATGCASVIPMICFIALCYVGCQRALAVFLMTLAVMSIGGMFCGFLSNHIDIAPNFAGTLMALTNTVATIPGIIVPVFVGKLTTADSSIRSWRIIFWTTVGFYIVEILVYMVFASGEEQPWNKVEESAGESQPLTSTKQKKEEINVEKPEVKAI
ncbi:major Facilitator Superfamily Transporter 3 [Leptinotarsa decemlineata]|uniref:major Facilitator Superfamily Transporter 3 n=1 Tax=Leptinotarsa decemlineata TaxID=7539 RepID=UPI003D306BE0